MFYCEYAVLCLVFFWVFSANLFVISLRQLIYKIKFVIVMILNGIYSCPTICQLRYDQFVVSVNLFVKIQFVIIWLWQLMLWYRYDCCDNNCYAIDMVVLSTCPVCCECCECSASVKSFVKLAQQANKALHSEIEDFNIQCDTLCKVPQP